MKRMLTHFQWVVFGLVGTIAGCQRVAETDQGMKNKLEHQVQTSTTTVLSARIGDSQSSPAAQAATGQKAELSPEAVCRAFLECLAQNDARGASQYLTPTSVINARRAELVWQAPGSPNAVYTLHPPRFATNKQRLATVLCTIRDHIDGEEIESELSWLVRLGDDGWRICGMVVQLDEEGPPDLLSFENPDDIAWIRANMEPAAFVAHETEEVPTKQQ